MLFELIPFHWIGSYIETLTQTFPFYNATSVLLIHMYRLFLNGRNEGDRNNFFFSFLHSIPQYILNYLYSIPSFFFFEFEFI